MSLNSIGPVWDGNEVWLVLGGGALFAAFPVVYASLFSGLYIAMMLVLLVLILRTVAIEFRSKRPSPRWRSFWDWVFFAASLGIALLLGVAFGNILDGLPIAADGYIRATLFDLLTPYALLVGVTTVFMLATHGAIYLSMKASGALLDRVKRWVPRLMVIFFVFNTLLVGMTVLLHEAVSERYWQQPWLVILTGRGAGFGGRGVAHGAPRAVLRSLRFFLGHDRRSADLGRRRSLPEPAGVDAQPVVQPDHLQRRVAGQHADRDADHGAHRHALRAALHGWRLLHLPWAGADRAKQLLSGAIGHGSGECGG